MFAGEEEEEVGGEPAGRLCMLSNTAAGMAAIVGLPNTIGSRSGGVRGRGGCVERGQEVFLQKKVQTAAG